MNLPQGYDGAEHTLLKGTTTNATHWTLIARCRGCTSYHDVDENLAVLNGTGTAQFAWAHGTTGLENPALNTSAFNVHQEFGKWTHDLNSSRSPMFESWVSSNLLVPAAGSSSSSSSAAPTTLSTATSAAPTPKASTAAPKASIPASCSGAGTAAFQGVLASGWKGTKVLGGLTSPRSIVFDTAGNMLVVQSGKGISYHVMSPDGCVTSTKMLVSLNSLNHGIALTPDGKTLYASSMTQAFAWPYDAAAGTVGTRSTVITGMF